MGAWKRGGSLLLFFWVRGGGGHGGVLVGKRLSSVRLSIGLAVPGQGRVRYRTGTGDWEHPTLTCTMAASQSSTAGKTLTQNSGLKTCVSSKTYRNG